MEIGEGLRGGGRGQGGAEGGVMKQRWKEKYYPYVFGAFKLCCCIVFPLVRNPVIFW
jgi:hypothetical protein